ncbi:MAG TPA: haloacid dehalogenase type II [Gaiellaceae bacterium]|nr:haloacid dehalogenase type II [Gaiellaceae bacterium]
MARPTLVLFDVNETLSDLRPLRRRLAEAGAPGDLLDLWFASTLRDGIALTAAGGYADFRTVASSVLRGRLEQIETLHGDPADAAEHVVSGFGDLDVHPDVEEGVRTLASAGVRLATLTNGSAEVARTLLERAGLADLVERHLSVEAVRRWKPAAEPYLYAARELAVPPADCALAAVHPWDVDGAKRAGLRAAWLDRAGGRYPEFFEQPDWSGRTLGSLADALLAA